MDRKLDFDEYGFNPFQFTGPDWAMRDFHARHAPYFAGCKRVLDLGSGRGFFLEALRECGIEGVGVDAHLPSCEISRQKGLTCYHAEIHEFFNTAQSAKVAASCDGVYCCHMIEHLEPREVFELFRCVKRGCAPEVRCRFITNNPEDITVLGYVFWGDLTHRRLYPGFLLAAMAKSQGFNSAKFKPFLGMKLGKRDQIRRFFDYFRWGRHKWLPNLQIDCC